MYKRQRDSRAFLGLPYQRSLSERVAGSPCAGLSHRKLGISASQPLLVLTGGDGLRVLCPSWGVDSVGFQHQSAPVVAEARGSGASFRPGIYGIESGGSSFELSGRASGRCRLVGVGACPTHVVDFSRYRPHHDGFALCHQRGKPGDIQRPRTWRR